MIPYPLTGAPLLVLCASCGIPWSRLWRSSQVSLHSCPFYLIIFKTASMSLLFYPFHQDMMASPFPMRCVLLSFLGNNGSLCCCSQSVVCPAAPTSLEILCLPLHLSLTLLPLIHCGSHFFSFTEIHIYCTLFNTKNHCINIFLTVMQPTCGALSCRGWWLDCLVLTFIQFVPWTGHFFGHSLSCCIWNEN